MLCLLAALGLYRPFLYDDPQLGGPLEPAGDASDGRSEPPAALAAELRRLRERGAVLEEGTLVGAGGGAGLTHFERSAKTNAGKAVKKGNKFGSSMSNAMAKAGKKAREVGKNIIDSAQERANVLTKIVKEGPENVAKYLDECATRRANGQSGPDDFPKAGCDIKEGGDTAENCAAEDDKALYLHCAKVKFGDTVANFWEAVKDKVSKFLKGVKGRIKGSDQSTAESTAELKGLKPLEEYVGVLVEMAEKYRREGELVAKAK